MPLLKLTTSVAVPPEKRDALLLDLSRLLAEVTHKPEAYCMILLDSACFLMAGKPTLAAYADVRGIGGFTRDVNGQITHRLCTLLQQRLSIPADAVYVTFIDVPASNWGWNSKTFG